MTAAIVFEGSNSKYIAKASEVLPWLVKYAQQRKTITYGDLAEKVGVDPHVELHQVLGVIGEALEKSDKSTPKIQLIVVDKKDRLVGNLGLGWLVPKDEIPNLSKEEKQRLCKGEQANVFDYDGWNDVLKRAGLEPVSVGPPLESLLQEAAESRGDGGEGGDHLILKEYVRAEPRSIGLKQKFTSRSTECALLSGDKIDVLLQSPAELTCIEVKGKTSSEADIRRGIFQCVKYRAVLQAEQFYIRSAEKPVISVYLVTANDLSNDLKRLAEFLGVPFIANVTVPPEFVVLDDSSSVAIRCARLVT